MKKLLKGLITILLTLTLTISVVASEITGNPDLPPEDNTGFSEHKDEEKEPDCGINCDLPIIDGVDGDY